MLHSKSQEGQPKDLKEKVRRKKRERGRLISRSWTKVIPACANSYSAMMKKIPANPTNPLHLTHRELNVLILILSKCFL